LEIAKKKTYRSQKRKPAAKISYQTLDARTKPLNSPPALAFSVFAMQ